jgi:hypothetical protein
MVDLERPRNSAACLSFQYSFIRKSPFDRLRSLVAPQWTASKRGAADPFALHRWCFVMQRVASLSKIVTANSKRAVCPYLSQRQEGPALRHGWPCTVRISRLPPLARKEAAACPANSPVACEKFHSKLCDARDGAWRTQKAKRPMTVLAIRRISSS